ncbi:MAG: hypothetical protein NTY75_02835 [Candidatus Shapirobacteria bacterium]|nr:hypothetical protein [Candidatus Shapirobacteria bacterium]
MPTISFACKKNGVARATFYRWVARSPKNKNLADDAIRQGIYYMNDFAESQTFALINDKNLNAIIFWLKHNHPKYIENRLALSPEDQQKLIKAINSTKQLKLSELVIDWIAQGKISKFFVNTITSIKDKLNVERIQNRRDEDEDNLREIIKKGRQLIETQENLPTTPQSPKALP